MLLKKNNGFTLIEVIVSIAIIAMIGVVLSGIVTTTLKARSISQERLHILALCTSTIDEIKSNQSSFEELADLDNWLQDNEFSVQSGHYIKADADTGIDIEIYINQIPEKTGLFEIKVTGKSTKASELSISTVVKGGNYN